MGFQNSIFVYGVIISELGLELGFWFQFRDGGESHLIEKTEKEK